MLTNFLPASWKRRRKRRGGGLNVAQRERSVVVVIMNSGFGTHWFGGSGFGDNKVLLVIYLIFV